MGKKLLVERLPCAKLALGLFGVCIVFGATAFVHAEDAELKVNLKDSATTHTQYDIIPRNEVADLTAAPNIKPVASVSDKDLEASNIFLSKAKRPLNFSAPGGGLRVEPGEIIVNNVPAGKEVSVFKLTGEKIKIKNNDKRPHKFSIRIYTSRESKNKILYGYEDIPSSEWIGAEVEEVQIDENETKQIDLLIKIPENKKYRGKNYQAIVEVRREKDNPKDLFVLAAQLRVCLKTK